MVNCDGLSDNVLREIVAFKDQGSSLVDFKSTADISVSVLNLAEADQVISFKGAVMVDCSATDATTPLLLEAIRNHASCALANKKPLSGPQQDFDELVAGASRASFRYEATVGAGLPVISPLCRQLRAGDRFSGEEGYVAGALSGTLGFVMSGLEDGHSFSSMVQKAFDEGFTGTLYTLAYSLAYILSHTLSHTFSHTLLSYTSLIHSSHTFSHTLLSYTTLIHSSHTLLSYTTLIHSSHTLPSYTTLTHYPHRA
jgi:hypothetical protein